MTRATAAAALLQALVADGVVVAAADIDDDETVHVDEAVVIQDAVAKRRREFAAGRRAARAALRAAGLALPGPLLPDDDRVPRWPTGVTGSITHAAGVALAAVARTATTRAIGIDVEDDAPLPYEVLSLVLTERERAAGTTTRTTTTTTTPSSRDDAKLRFCIKESVYKCVFPLARMTFDFLDVDVDADAGQDEGGFSAQVNKPGASPVQVVRGRWARGSGLFVAVTTL